MLEIFKAKQFFSILICCAVVLTMQGCGNKADCNDNQTKENAINIIQSHLENWDKDIILAITGTSKLTDVRSLSKDENLGQAQCVAAYTFTYNKKEREIEVQYYLSYLEDKKQVDVKVGIDDLKRGIMTMAIGEPAIKNGVEGITNPENGKIKRAVEWKDGLRVAEKVWSDDGLTLIQDINWIDGKANGFESRSQDGKVVTNLVWKDGKQTGTLSTLDEEYNFKDGKYDGDHVRYGFSSSGRKPILKETYKDGKLHGTRHEYSDDGVITQETVYENGEKISEKIFDYSETHPVEVCVSKQVDEFITAGINVTPTAEQMENWQSECLKHSSTAGLTES
jgi:antitoxin component YwqK of YwqJK toxin-antitoxin module